MAENNTQESASSEQEKRALSGILDKIIDSKQAANLQNFEPSMVAGKILNLLKDRDKQILAKRFGLLGFSPKTLEAIGKEHNLTRERVRQIEKDSMKFLRSKLDQEQLSDAVKTLAHIISDSGKIIKELELIKMLSFDATEEEKRSILFLLHIAEELLEETRLMLKQTINCASNGRLQSDLEQTVRSYLYSKTKRRPMVFVTVHNAEKS